jgi:2OG-Fe(II) oxygenase superfamily
MTERRVNPFLYLNEDWRPENGGDLALWNADMRRCVEKIRLDTNSDQSPGRVLGFGDRFFQRRRGGP